MLLHVELGLDNKILCIDTPLLKVQQLSGHI
jgi:hypothetical protein